MKRLVTISEQVSVLAESGFVNHISAIVNTYQGERQLAIFLAEHSLDGPRDHFNGISQALHYAKAHPEEDILLLSFLAVEDFLRINNHKIPLLLSLPNCFFDRLPLNKISLNGYQNNETIKQRTGKSLDVIVSSLNHTTYRHLNDSEESIRSALVERAEQVEILRHYFSELRHLEGREFISKLKDLNDEILIEEVMAGQDIFGVYCDIEGTLLINDMLQEEVLNKLNAYSEQGLTVTIWTLGDVEHYSRLIGSMGIKYPVRSKMDYFGATAEIVIDDDSEESFRAKTKINPKKFIRV